MIYLDNAATSWPKPPEVLDYAKQVMKEFGANPGRGGYPMTIKASQIVYDTRCKLATLFNSDKEENVIFTANCTESINYVIKGLLEKGDHVIISDMEHNATSRPVFALSKKGVSYDVAKVEKEKSETLKNFEKLIRPSTKLIACLYASNVTGEKLPIKELGELAKKNDIYFMCDAAQGAGYDNIDVKALNIDFLCMPGHKGLLGPMGTGVLIINNDIALNTIIEGGTGSMSSSFAQPLDLPDRFEAGTVNLPGIAGLSKGIDFLNKVGIENISGHEMKLVKKVYDTFKKKKNILLYTSVFDSRYVPLLSFNIDGEDSSVVASYLGENDICVRGGLHCNPLAHRKTKTEEMGTVRISPSYFTKMKDIDKFLRVVDIYKK